MNRMILADLVHRQDIWMIEGDYRVRFLLKALQTFRIPCKAHGQNCECSLAPRGNVVGEIDFAPPARAYRFRNFVVADRLTDQQVSLPISNNSRRNTGS